MTTLADLRGSLRVMLSDNVPGSYLWTDAALRLHINDAIRSYSGTFPREAETSISTVAQQARYDLPADCVRVVGVGLGASGEVALQEGGDAFGEGYEVYGGDLVLMPAPSEPGCVVTVRYLASHAGLTSDGDVSTVPSADEDLLLALAAFQAIAALMAEDSRRQLLEGRTGQPASAAAELYRRWYEEGVADRLARARVRRLVAG